MVGYGQGVGAPAVMGAIIILSVQALVSPAILIYYERFHRYEVNWRRTRRSTSSATSPPSASKQAA